MRRIKSHAQSQKELCYYLDKDSFPFESKILSKQLEKNMSVIHEHMSVWASKSQMKFNILQSHWRKMRKRTL